MNIVNAMMSFTKCEDLLYSQDPTMNNYYDETVCISVFLLSSLSHHCSSYTTTPFCINFCYTCCCSLLLFYKSRHAAAAFYTTMPYCINFLHILFRYTLFYTDFT
mmetsp:Transcript_23646/g.39469  ORF Transcript_23646/g.39469 Transcript_23646/m.39469 type:complete len:105 (+) Transcript_23646:167-481(+)